MEVWGVNKLKDPNSNHIIRKVIKRREQLLQRQQTPKVLKELKYLDNRMDIGQMLLDRWYEKSQIEKQSISPALSSTHLDNRL
jgi:hypothetical protein